MNFEVGQRSIDLVDCSVVLLMLRLFVHLSEKNVLCSRGVRDGDHTIIKDSREMM